MKLSQQPLIHPDLLQHLHSRYPSICSIYIATATQNEYNEPVITYDPDPQLQVLYCFVQPESGAETRQPGQTIELNRWIIGLRGFYGTIKPLDQAIVDGVEYNILRVAHDDFETATYLTAERVT